MKIYKIRLSNAVFATIACIFLVALSILIISSVVAESEYLRWQGQAKMALAVLGAVAFTYAIFFAFSFRINVYDDAVEMHKPPLSWYSQEKYRLRWDEIEKVKIGPFVVPEAKPYVLIPKKETGKRPIRIQSWLENFPELLGLISQKIKIEEPVKAWIKYDLEHLHYKWSLSRLLFLAIVAVVITFIACLILGIIRLPLPI